MLHSDCSKHAVSSNLHTNHGEGLFYLFDGVAISPLLHRTTYGASAQCVIHFGSKTTTELSLYFKLPWAIFWMMIDLLLTEIMYLMNKTPSLEVGMHFFYMVHAVAS